MNIDSTKLAIEVLNGALAIEDIPLEIHGRIASALELLDKTDNDAYEAALISAFEYLRQDDETLDDINRLLEKYAKNV